MQLLHLALANFKNIQNAELDFSPKVNCFLGNNGMGKSNLLDAIYYLSYCRSFTGTPDNMLVRRGDNFAALRALYRRRDLDEEVTAAIRPGTRKMFRRAGKPYKRLSEHLGAFPAVLISPADMELSAGEPSERRRFLDQISAQRDARYLDALLRYNNALEQRNRLLKTENTDTSLFEILEFQLENAADYLTAARKQTVQELTELFRPCYQAVAGTDEEADISYQTSDYSAGGGLAAHLAANRGRDMVLKHTGSGPHRDDLLLSLDGMTVRRTASQGQAKTFTISLRFAQYELLHRSLELKPLLLLDDIFDKLDSRRVERIISLVSTSDTFGQIFITDTNRRHLDETIAALGDRKSVV